LTQQASIIDIIDKTELPVQVLTLFNSYSDTDCKILEQIAHLSRRLNPVTDSSSQMQLRASQD